MARKSSDAFLFFFSAELAFAGVAGVAALFAPGARWLLLAALAALVVFCALAVSLHVRRTTSSGAPLAQGASTGALASAAPGQSAALERLAGGVAHDFNNILLVVRGYTELVLGEQDLAQGARGHLQEVMAALTRASELIAQLLAVGRRVSSSPAEIDLNEAVTQALERVHGARESVQLGFAAGPDLPRLMASADQVERLVIGLATYAKERTADGGSVSIETRCPRRGTGRDFITLHVTAPEAVVSDDERLHLFEPFYVSQVTGRRMGLGLAAARGIVSVLDGEISAHGLSSGGIEFLVTLPTRRQNHTEPSSGVRGTVLLADDDAVILELASRVLSKEGFNVLAAGDGEEALRLFERNGEAIRIAVLDDVMPKASGRMVIERIRSARPSLPVILCTAYEWGVQDTLRGAEQILSKPYDPRELVRCVRRTLGSAV